MTHDPLCPVGVKPWEDTYCCQTCNPGETPPWEPACRCDEYAKVRADERSQAGARVAGLVHWEDGWPENVVVNRASAIYAAESVDDE